MSKGAKERPIVLIELVFLTDYESSKGVKVRACNLSTWEVEARVQGQPQLCGKYKVSLGYMTLSQNKTKTTR